eukprot:TRINITY_DN12144_c0_g1_i14.p1 TRINITY_DN12144_c0_g1~~TRINITY_DN12144_c0_g1_i14.p1  ORF type:complete len:497 (+),score=103.11 TRINITY_DN12144_c0_g1_i14:1454-2944(+)
MALTTIDDEAVCSIEHDPSMLPENRPDMVWQWIDEVTEDEVKLKRRGKGLSTAEQFELESGFTIVLNMWDNTVGPRPRHVWFASKRPAECFYHTLLYNSSKVSLGGELNRTHSERGTPLFKLYRWQELGHEMAIFVFQCTVLGDPTVFSLGLISDIKAGPSYASLHNLISEHISSMTQSLATQCLTAPSLQEAIQEISPQIRTLCQHLSQLGLKDLSVTGVDVSRTYFDASHSHSIKSDLLAKALSSHLQTQGRSVIMGSNPQAVDYFINTLAMLIRPTDWPRCRRFQTDFNQFNSDLVVQGILLDDIMTRKRVEQDVLEQARHAVSLIDLDAHAVKQTQREDKMAYMVEVRQANEFERVRSGSAAPEPDKKRRLLFKFREVRYQAPLITALLKDIRGPRISTYKRALLQHFIRSLHRKALSLLQYAYSHAEPKPCLTHAQLTTLRKELHLSNDEDFELIVATAAGLDENTYSLLFQPTDAKEHQLASLLFNDLMV